MKDELETLPGLASPPAGVGIEALQSQPVAVIEDMDLPAATVDLLPIKKDFSEAFSDALPPALAIPSQINHFDGVSKMSPSPPSHFFQQQ